MKIALLSPHLDDAVFSVGGLMAVLADEGHEVHVVTCFTRSVPHPAGFALDCQLDKGLSAEVDYMQLRREEDARACDLLNAQPHWLNLPEAPHRGYHSAAALFGNFAEGDMVQSELQEQLENVVAMIEPDLILSPQGIGSHVDHRQVRRAVVRLQEQSSNTLFLRWYDEPYLARHPEQYPKQVIDAGGTGWAVLHELATHPGSAVVKIDVEAFADRKIAACAAYATQVGFQFGGAAAIRAGLAKRGRLEELVAGEDTFTLLSRR
ncbi:MAG: PIG-L family deacetylase [Tunicatimonas sp.]